MIQGLLLETYAKNGKKVSESKYWLKRLIVVKCISKHSTPWEINGVIDHREVKNMNNYEAVLIFKADMQDADRTALLERFITIIYENG